MRSRQFGILGALCIAVPAVAQEFGAKQLQAFYDKVSPAVAIVDYSSNVTNPGTGEQTKRTTKALGLIVSARGLVMAHGHMQIENSEPFSIKVSVGQGSTVQEYEGKLLTKPKDVNVCFVQIVNDKNIAFPHVDFASAPLGLGDPVALIGLMGDTLDYNRAMVVRRIGSVIEKPRKTYCLDERLLFGYVGSPVMDFAGRVIGVIGFDLSTQEGGDLYVRSGHPLVYQSDLFAKYIANPPGESEAKPAGDGAFLGVFSQPMTDDLAEYWKLPANGGIVVSTVMPDSPAGAAGLRPGDVIVRFNDVPVMAKLDREVLGFTKLVVEAGVGAKVPIQYYRGGQLADVTVTLAERPKSSRDAGEFEDKVFGLTVREITTDLRVALNLGADIEGVIVRRVKSGSWAQLGEMAPGVIVMNFGGHPVKSIDDFKAAAEKVAAEKPAEFTVFARVGSKTGFFRLQPRWGAGN